MLKIMYMLKNLVESSAMTVQLHLLRVLYCVMLLISKMTPRGTVSKGKKDKFGYTINLVSSSFQIDT